MQLVTVGSKYQIVIPKEVRKKNKGIKPTGENTITVKPRHKLWSDESYGFMKEAWKDIDPAIETEKMRDEWDERSR